MVIIPDVEQESEPILIKLVEPDSPISDRNREQIEMNLAMGIPVIAGTRKPSENLAAASAISTGISTGHTVAVLRVATAYKKGEEKQGLLIFDPYGEAKGSFNVDRIAKKEMAFQETAGSPVKFILWDEVSQIFEEIAFARGSLKIN